MAMIRTLTALLALAPLAASADVKLPAVFSDNMVLQQGLPVTVWGWADEGEQVTVEFAGQKASSTAFRRLPNPLSRWTVKLAPLKASATASSLVVQGRNRLERKNVLVGEVWLASGQSNMEMALRSTHEPDATVAAATNPLIRLFTVQRVRTNAPADDVRGGPWQPCNPTTAAGYSAVGYYFARDLQKALGVPIGIIHSSWGGTPAEAWTSRGTLEAHAELRRDFVDRITQLRAGYAGAVDTFNKETEVLKKQGKKQTAPPPKVPAMPTWQGAELHNGMIAPLVPFALKGAIWYQGEANASRAAQYKVLFAEMIKGWRREWELGDFPFLAVQLAPYDHARKRTIEEITAAPGDSDWARLRESQLHVALATPKTALAVITDAGDKDDIHPKLKEPAGARLALAARAVAYGEQVAWSGPVFKSMTVEGARAIVSFEHVGKGLEARGGKLTGFALCGDDRKFVWAGAEILPDNRVVVSHTDVKKPVAVRYGWADFPVVNLWNKEGLPASPFRTDTFSVAAPPTASKTPAKK